jgi:hypothetical protein
LPFPRSASRAFIYDHDTIIIIGGDAGGFGVQEQHWAIAYTISTQSYRTLPWIYRTDPPYGPPQHPRSAPLQLSDGSLIMTSIGISPISAAYSLWWLPADRVDIHRKVEWHHWYRLPNVPSDEIFAIFPWD